jgi:hypothetical protein
VEFSKQFKGTVNLVYVNIRSLLPKFVLFTALAHSANPDVLAVSESWLRKATYNPEISIPNVMSACRWQVSQAQENELGINRVV